MVSKKQAPERGVAITSEDLTDLRKKLDGGSFDAKERDIIKFLTARAEKSMEQEVKKQASLWTWTYRF